MSLKHLVFDCSVALTLCAMCPVHIAIVPSVTCPLLLCASLRSVHGQYVLSIQEKHTHHPSIWTFMTKIVVFLIVFLNITLL